jgi:hypothetical protein
MSYNYGGSLASMRKQSQKNLETFNNNLSGIDWDDYNQGWVGANPDNPGAYANMAVGNMIDYAGGNSLLSPAYVNRLKSNAGNAYMQQMMSAMGDTANPNAGLPGNTGTGRRGSFPNYFLSWMQGNAPTYSSLNGTGQVGWGQANPAQTKESFQNMINQMGKYYQNEQDEAAGGKARYNMTPEWTNFFSNLNQNQDQLKSYTMSALQNQFSPAAWSAMSGAIDNQFEKWGQPDYSGLNWLDIIRNTVGGRFNVPTLQPSTFIL